MTGSFLVRILPYGRSMEMVISGVFFSAECTIVMVVGAVVR